MNIQRLLPFALIAFAGLSLGSGCPTIPTIQDRVVELAAGASTTLEFQADGIVNTWDGSGTYDLSQDIDLRAVLDDAGIDAEDVRDIKLSGISYRVAVPDPTPGRKIVGTTVTAHRGAGAETPLVTSFSQNVDAPTGWITAPVSSGGVAILNSLLSDILANVKNGTPIVSPNVTYHIQGSSEPTGVPTSFTWQMKIDVSIVGKIEVKVIDK